MEERLLRDHLTRYATVVRFRYYRTAESTNRPEGGADPRSEPAGGVGGVARASHGAQHPGDRVRHACGGRAPGRPCGLDVPRGADRPVPAWPAVYGPHTGGPRPDSHTPRRQEIGASGAPLLCAGRDVPRQRRRVPGSTHRDPGFVRPGCGTPDCGPRAHGDGNRAAHRLAVRPDHPDAQVVWAEVPAPLLQGAWYHHGLRFLRVDPWSELPLQAFLCGLR
jgi:hypothetical protein